MDTIRRKIQLIEDQEINDDDEELPSEYSGKKSLKKRKRKKQPSDVETQSNASRASFSKQSRRRLKARQKQSEIINLEKVSSKSRPSDSSQPDAQKPSKENNSKADKNVNSKNSQFKEDQSSPEKSGRNSDSIKSKKLNKKSRSRSSKDSIATRIRKDSENAPIDKIEEVDDEHQNHDDTIEASKPKDTQSKSKGKKTTTGNYEETDKQKILKEDQNITILHTVDNRQSNQAAQNNQFSQNTLKVENNIRIKGSRRSSKSKSRRKSKMSNRAEVQEVEVSLNLVKNAEHFDSHDTQDKLREMSVDSNSGELIKVQNDSQKSIKLIKNRSKSLLEQSHSSQTQGHKISESRKVSPVETQDKDMEDEHEEHNIQNSDSVMKPKFKNLNKFKSKDEESKKQENLMDDDNEMECEGGSQGEEEQSESSEGMQSDMSKSDIEGEESESDENIIIERRQPITIKDIDKEFWRILHSYRPEINQLQLDHNSIRDSITENCKIVRVDAEDMVNNLNKKIEIDLKEQMLYIKTLQNDIEICQKKLKRERTDFTIETQNLSDKIENFTGKLEYLLNSVKTLSNLT